MHEGQQPQQLATNSLQVRQHANKNYLFTQLFQLSKINQNVYNNQSSQQQSQTSLITQFIMNKIRQQQQQPWKLLNNISKLIDQLVSIFTKQQNSFVFQKERSDNIKSKIILYKGNNLYRHNTVLGFKCIGSVQFLNPDSVYIGQGTIIQHGALIMGPCIIGSNCQIRKGAYIRGNVIIGNSSLVGNSCQLKNCILMDKCQIAHFNYIGDSILGMYVHFSAGGITSNYKLDGSQIKVNANLSSNQNQKNQKIEQTNKIIKTNRNKLGALVGHNSEIGCNAILNPGSIIGKNSVIYPLVNWRGSLPANRICKLTQQQQIVQKK